MSTGRQFSYATMARSATPWLIILLFLLIGYRSVMPPAPLSIETPQDMFAAERAIEHVKAIAVEPHPMGTAANAAVRAYIVDQLAGLGIQTELQETSARDYFGSQVVPVVNVIARIPGTASTGAIALVAHYDTVPTTAGANDNSTAVAALLETGRALRAGVPLQNDILLLFTDAEEPAPHFGATAFATWYDRFAEIGLVVNLETNGGSGASILAETNGPQRWLIRELGEAENTSAAFSFVTEMTRLIGEIGTDFDVFRDAGIPGFHFAYLRGSPIYHTDADNIDAVSLGSLQHHGSHALGIAQHFGDTDLNQHHADETSVFFFIRPFLVAYPTSWAIPLAVGAMVLSGTAIAKRRSRQPGNAPLAKPAAILITVGLVAIVAGTLVWTVVASLRPSVGVAESYVYLLCIVAGTAALAAKAVRKMHAADRGAIVAVWAALALLTALTLPGFSYLFLWPVVVAATAFLPARNTDRTRPIGFSAVVAVTLVVNVPAVEVFFQFAQPRPGGPDSSIPSTVAAALVIALLIVGLIGAVWPLRKSTDQR